MLAAGSIAEAEAKLPIAHLPATAIQVTEIKPEVHGAISALPDQRADLTQHRRDLPQHGLAHLGR
jgi:hypothetical protein